MGAWMMGAVNPSRVAREAPAAGAEDEDWDMMVSLERGIPGLNGQE